MSARHFSLSIRNRPFWLRCLGIPEAEQKPDHQQHLPDERDARDGDRVSVQEHRTEGFPTHAGDVHLVPTPGHSSGHLSVIVRDGDHSLFLAGDTSYTEGHLVAEQVDGVSSLGGGEAAALSTIRRIRAYARDRSMVYLPSHDPDSARRLGDRQLLGGSGLAQVA